MKLLRYILVFIGLLLLSTSASASHIIGGNFSVQWISGNDFEVTMRVYRDCGTPPKAEFLLLDSMYIGLFDLKTDERVQVVRPTSFVRDTVAIGTACFSPKDLCVEEGLFRTIITIPDNPNGYYLSWERCCRNAIIRNITTPGFVGMTFYAEIADPALKNSSPDFGDYPTDSYFCVNWLTYTNLSATDADGDSLVYSLVDPKSSPNAPFTLSWNTDPQSGNYPPIAWEPGYNANNVTGGTPDLYINPKTGIASVAVDSFGVYVFAVNVNEYRDGIRIGRTRFELQYEAVLCEGNQPPQFSLNPGDTIFLIGEIGDTCLSIDAIDADTDNPLWLQSFVVPGENGNGDITFTNTNVANGGAIGSPLCWNLGCSDIRDEPYELNFFASDNSICGADTSYLDLYIKVISGNEPPEISIPSVGRDTVKITALDRLIFDVFVTDPNDYDSITLEGFSPLFESNNGIVRASFQDKVGSGGILISQFDWETICADISSNTYNTRFRAFDDGCFPDTVDIEVEIDVASILRGVIDAAPNVITPNGDGLNERFKLNALRDPCFDKFEIKIFNRWGKVVFESTDIFFEWDGKTKSGRDASDGVYFYMIEGNFRGTEFKRRDNVHLIR